MSPYLNPKKIVPAEWIDVNGHMNATHYMLAVYEAHVTLTQAIGLGDAYVDETNCGKAVLESHMVYEREVGEGDEIQIFSWVLAVDEKRIHFFHELMNITRDCRAATSEQLDIHMDLTARRTSPIPEAIRIKLQEIVRENEKNELPKGIGSIIRPPEKS